MENEDTLVRMNNIYKSFGPVRALKNVSIQIGKPEIVGLLGDNGAGKTTLVNILSGVYPPDKGEIFYQGTKVNVSSPRQARNMGIETVHQRLSLVETMSIARNFFLGKELTKKVGPLTCLDKKEMNKRCSRIIEEIGVKMRSPDEFVSTLSGGERQAIAIGRAMYYGAKLLILDEPVRALSVSEQRTILNNIRQVKEEGSSVIFITHNVHHVYPVADRFIILDNGQKIGKRSKEEVSPEDVAEIIATGKML